MTKSELETARPGGVVRRILLDALLGAAVYVIASAVIFGGHATAAAIDAAVVGMAPAHWTAFMLIGAAFSALFAFNLTFYRVLKQKYAGESRRTRRSGDGPWA